MPQSIITKALGKNTEPNQIDLPPGSLTVASNVVIRRDGVVEPRRGYFLYGNSMGSSSDRAKQLMTYKQRILRHFSNQLQYDSDGEGNFLSFCGTYLEPQVGRRIRFLESNGNFYFTTADGVERISVKTNADFTTECPSPNIKPAGGIKALDVSTRLHITQGNESGFLPQDSAVAYRVVWGFNDANGNLILGTPSPRSVIFNPLINLELMDFNKLLTELDNVSDNSAHPSLISDGNYFTTLGLPSTASANDLLTNLISLAQKIDLDILFADTVSAPLQILGAAISNGIGTVTFSSGNASDYFSSGDSINLTGFNPTTGILNGPQTVTTTFPSFSTTGDTQTGLQEIQTIQTVADVGGSLAGAYFYINDAEDTNQYYVWYFVGGSGSDPHIAGKTAIQVNINTNDADTVVATATANALAGRTGSFTTSVSTNTITVTNVAVGTTTPATSQTSGFVMTETQAGTDGNVITSVASTSGINVGTIVTDTDGAIPVGTYVTSIGIGSITISNPVTSTNIGDTLTFGSGVNFLTTATGPVTISTPTIYSNEFENIGQPAVPSIPPTDGQLVAIQQYMQAIIVQLQSESSTGTPPTISSDSQTRFIAPFQLTTNATVYVTFTIPPGVTTSDFYQIYRSEIAQATGTQVLETDVSPSDELQLVFEGFPTQAQITTGQITVEDVTPPEFAGAFLYTNETTGDGILQANDLPPFALDIARFKNVVFYANTRTRNRLTINLLGVTQLITDALAGNVPSFTISDGVTSNTYTFVVGVQEIIKVTTIADVAGSLAGKYFTFNSANDNDQYYVWYNVSGVGVDPAPVDLTGIEVFLNTNDSANTVASKTAAAISVFVNDFSVSVATNVITIINNEEGACTAPNAHTSGFSVAVTQTGVGQNAAAHQILLSNVASPAEAVNNTALSLVNVLNLNPNEIVSAFYLSTAQSIPGEILLESRSLSDAPFYIVANNSDTGSAFNPDISPTIFISNISAANPTIITTSTPHGLINQDKVIINNSNSTPSIDGVHQITFIDSTHFSLPINVTIAGNRGALINTTSAVTSDNEALANRIYFSKILQPDAVPLVNTIDVGAQDKAILRIFPLRDSLFVYKEDGLFRISGETAPFNLALFDSSVILIAPDSLDVSNNLIYGWTTQGISATSESGVNTISRPIDTDILKLATTQYTSFKSATWGIGYDSDNSYTAYTVQQTSDTVATIGYRFSTLTNTWTTFDKTDTCGVINSVNDRQYLGAGDTNFLEEERKNFDRLDYADREFEVPLIANNYYGNQLQLLDITNIKPGDVITQDQEMTIFGFNGLLQKLDSDVLLSPHTYVTNNEMSAGDTPRDKLDVLIAQIAADSGRNAQAGHLPGSSYLAYQSDLTVSTITNISASDPTVITTSAPHGLENGRIVIISGSNSVPSIDGSFTVSVLTSTTFTIPVSVTVVGTTGSLSVDNNNFADIEASYNGIITLLNNDSGVGFNNYMQIVNDTLQEAIILSVSPITKRITLNLALDFMVGPLTVFKAIDSMIQWGPQTFGDPLGLKQVREATLMFENKAFTSATLSFSSDLLPAFIDVPFKGDGNGIFGYTGIPQQFQGTTGQTGFGYGFFGGNSNSAPFRTYVPRDAQRCRYLNCLFTHQTAREKYSIFGITLTGEISQSSRAYR